MERKITIEEKVLYREDYQIHMLKANNLNGILKMGGRGINESSYYDYDVSGKISIKAMFERSKIGAEDIKKFLLDFRNAVREVETFLLNIDCILLKPEYIFYEEGKYFFCYYPLAQQDLWEEFHELTEYFVKQADYQDEECIRMVFLLHKKTMDENYSLEKLTSECMKNPGKDDHTECEANCQTSEIYWDLKECEGMEDEDKYRIRNKEKDRGYMEDSESEHDWITEQEMGKRDWILEQEMRSSIMKESDTLWAPVKRLLNKRKKPKWGDWDGLHIEEEDFS